MILIKLVIAILDQEDAQTVSDELNRQGYSSTVSDAKGSFLQAGKSIILIAVNSINVDAVTAIIGEYSHSREKEVPEADGHSDRPVSVKVGGALVMVMNIEKFDKL